MSKEFKHYELRRARKPASLGGLSSTVIVIRENGDSGFCYVKFSDSLVTAVGRKLPRGVSFDDPAYLEARYDRAKNWWEISARYLNTDTSVKLWTAVQKPLWLTFNSENENGIGSKTEAGSRRGSANEDCRSRAEAYDSHQAYCAGTG